MSYRIVVIVACLVVLSAGAAFAAAPYTVTDLGNLGYSATGQASAVVNGNLEIVGMGQETSASNYDGWYWTQSTGIQNVDPILQNAFTSIIPAGDTWGGSSATGVNASGQIVGTYSSYHVTEGQTQTSTFGFVYTIGGTPTTFAVPGNTNPANQPWNGFSCNSVSNVNSSGTVCGIGTIGMDPTSNPFTYNVNSQTFTDLYLSSGGGSGVAATGAAAINNNGWIAGAYQDNQNVPTTAQVWNGSTWNDLGVPSGTWNNNGTPTNYGKGSHGIAIDTNGDVVGVVGTNTPTKGDAMYVPYNGSSWGTMVDLGNLGGYLSGYTNSLATGISDDGHVVGYAFNGVRAPATEAAFLSGTAAGSMVPLSGLVANLNGWSLCTALSIDNLDDIIGLGINAGGNQDAYLLTALPGDANLDGKVDINDLTIVLAHYNQSGSTWGQGEFTGDGKVDINDLTIVLAHYGQTVGASAGSSPSAVPEPGTLAVLGAGLAGLLAYAWRKRK